MLLQLLMTIPIQAVSALTSWLPAVTELPFGIDAVLVQGMGYFHYLSTVFPPFTVMWEAFIVVLTFKMSLKVIAMLPLIRGVLYKA